jgi:hypothetical protein
MGLDVYVGSLTRYLARDWKTVIEQLAERGELPEVQIVRPQGGDVAVTDPEQIRPVVLAWRQGLSAGLGAHLSAPLDWDESDATPYFTDKPAWDCYGALLLWAAYAEHPELPRPAQNPLSGEGGSRGGWHADPAFRASTTRGFPTRFGQLLDDVEIWLPAPFDFTFEAEWITGRTCRFGSCTALLVQLDDLNAATWRAGADDVERWRREGAERGAPLEVGARFAWALLRNLAGEAATHRLPMLLDY